MNIAIIGRGKVGSALARALRSQTNRIALLGKSFSDRNVRDAKLVILALPDSEITRTSRELASYIPKGAVVVHCAGSKAVDELAACKKAGAYVGVLHPLVSFAHKTKSPSFRKTVFAFYGDNKALRLLRRVLQPLGVKVIRIRSAGPSYHAAAALAANGSVALAWNSARILQKLGLSKRDANLALASLLQSVAENIRAVGVPLALTGPVARGDEKAVREHINALKKISPDFASAYQDITKQIRATAKARSSKPK